MSNENPAKVELLLRNGKECMRDVKDGKEYLSGM